MELSDQEEEMDNDEQTPNKVDEEIDEMEDILNDPDFQNMSDSDGDDLPLFENLSEDEKDGNEDGTYRVRVFSFGARDLVDRLKDEGRFDSVELED